MIVKAEYDLKTERHIVKEVVDSNKLSTSRNYGGAGSSLGKATTPIRSKRGDVAP